MHVFVTGASGFVGESLCKELVNKNYSLTVLLRNEESVKKFKELKVRIVKSDILKPKMFRDDINKCDVLVHLAGLRANWGDPSEFYKINSESINGIVKQKTNLQHIIICSSVYVYGDLKRMPASESHPMLAKDVYGKSKVLLEQFAKIEANKYKIPYTIIRPAIVYGPGDNSLSFINKLISILKKRIVIIAGRGNNLVHLIYIDDLIQGIISIIKKGGKNQEYNLAGENPIELSKLIRIIGKRLEVSFRVIKVPYISLLFIAYLFEFFYKICYKIAPIKFAKEPFILPTKVKSIGRNWHYDISKAKKELGFSPKFTYEQGIAKIFESRKS
jgi:nucleoside-diphosphate-sugar epimerase